MRRKAGLTQTELAYLLARKRSAVSKLELGRVLISAKTLLACCIIFDCTPQELLPGVAEDTSKEMIPRAIKLKRKDSSGVSVRSLKREPALQKLIDRKL